MWSLHSDLFEKFLVDFVSFYFTNTYAIFCNFIDEFLAINQINLLFAWVAGFFTSRLGKCSSCDKNAFFYVCG